VIPLCGGTLQQTKYSSFFLFLFLSRESTLLSCLVGLFKTEPIQQKNCKPNQSKSKPQKTAFDLDVFGSIFYSIAWFVSVCGFDFTNRTKPNQTAT